jgi:exopolysaccharide biosynthesis polyprenyl glycosylphosphotransferase
VLFRSNLKKIKRYININNYSLAGYCGPSGFQSDDEFELFFLGTFNQTPEVISKAGIDEIIILNYSKDKKLSQTILGKIEKFSVLVRIVPGTLETMTGQLSMKGMSENPIISIRPRKIPVSYLIAKRLFDIFVSFFGLIFTGFTYPIIACLIKKSSRGKVIFKQIRLGENNKPFMMYKYRSMYDDAEKEGPQLANENDERITSIGKFLRKFHFDELPQFWNIFKGDMSLVGPRPERAYYAKILTRNVPYYQYISKRKPGLTSLGMVKYGYAHTIEEMEERLIYDAIYINNTSFITDIQIIIYTIIYLIKKLFSKSY